MGVIVRENTDEDAFERYVEMMYESIKGMVPSDYRLVLSVPPAIRHFLGDTFTKYELPVMVDETIPVEGDKTWARVDAIPIENEENVMLNNKYVVKAYGVTQDAAEAIQTRLNDWAESGKPLCVIPMNEGEELDFEVVEYGEEIAVGHDHAPQITISGPASQIAVTSEGIHGHYVTDVNYKRLLWYKSVYHEAMKVTARGGNLTYWFKGLAACDIDIKQDQKDWFRWAAAYEADLQAREKADG